MGFKRGKLICLSIANIMTDILKKCFLASPAAAICISSCSSLSYLVAMETKMHKKTNY